jgi:CheY-like chemotaxis protein
MNQEPSHILLIEDNPADVELIKECLRLRGIPYELTHCDTVDAAVKLVNGYGTDERRPPDLMLLDYNLPRGEARAVLHASTANPALGKMRKAVVTSSLAPKDRQEALQFGADTFINKPADLEKFFSSVGDKISELLGRG